MEVSSDYQQATQLLSRLYGALDERDYKTVAGCFSADSKWFRQGKVLQRDDIVKALQQRSPTLVVHHIYSNCLFDSRQEGRLKVRYLLSVFQVDPGEMPNETALFATSPQVGFCDAELVITAGEWRVLAMQARPPTFKAGPA